MKSNGNGREAYEKIELLADVPIPHQLYIIYIIRITTTR